MAEGTYTEPWTGNRDELRFLFQDAAGPGFIFSDTVYDTALTNKSLIAAAVFLAQSYAAYYANLIAQYGNTRQGTQVRWSEREKFYQKMADDILNKRITIGTIGTPAVMYGAMTAGAQDDAIFAQRGYWPDPNPLAVIEPPAID